MHKRNKHNAACTSGQEQTKGMASEISWIRLDSQYFEQNSSVPIGVPANSIPSDLIIISVGSCNRHNSMSTIEGGMYMLDFCMLIESPHSDREWLNLFQSPKSEKAAGSTMKLISSWKAIMQPNDTPEEGFKILLRFLIIGAWIPILKRADPRVSPCFTPSSLLIDVKVPSIDFVHSLLKFPYRQLTQGRRCGKFCRISWKIVLRSKELKAFFKSTLNRTNEGLSLRVCCIICEIDSRPQLDRPNWKGSR